MKAPPGAIDTIEELKAVLSRNPKFLFLSPRCDHYGILKFRIDDPTLKSCGDNSVIAQAYEITRQQTYNTGVVAFDGLNSHRRWWWFENYWLAYAADLHAHKQGNK